MYVEIERIEKVYFMQILVLRKVMLKYINVR